MAQTLHDGSGRRIGRNHETPIAPRLLNDVGTFDVSAQLYVGPLHVLDDAREAGCVQGNSVFLSPCSVVLRSARHATTSAPLGTTGHPCGGRPRLWRRSE